jgi:hypothetical protein
MWGFERVTEGVDKGSYCHDNFVKGQESLCAKMIRTKIKGTGIRKGSIPSMVETTSPPLPLKRIVSLGDNREDTTTADAGCAGEKNEALCAAEGEGVVMNAFFPKACNNRDQREQEECWMGSSISSIIFEDDEGGQKAEWLATSSKRSARCSIFFDVGDTGMGQNQEERQSKRTRRSSSMCSIIFDGDGIFDRDGRVSSSFGGRSFYVVDDYNPPHQPASSCAAQSLQQQQQTRAASLMKGSSSTAASGMKTSCENDWKQHIQGLLGANSLVSMASPPAGASNFTAQEAELTNDKLLALLSAEQLFSQSSPMLHHDQQAQHHGCCKKEQETSE